MDDDDRKENAREDHVFVSRLVCCGEITETLQLNAKDAQRMCLAPFVVK